ncbi:leucine-rich repeat domain-containing protein [Fibrivirga algicola]|uniref:Leucine-rich repeat domain-containing protein n=1 Tax=Fibrivirga algicola TaxID=2950420 RepID=A0ABX0QC98_9BACT|nr:hypothetical protein [Fibrivirga algicola]NID09995.1 hypothetical protein [Fibrivirga algicola]
MHTNLRFVNLLPSLCLVLITCLMIACDHRDPEPELYTAVPDINFEKELIKLKIDDVQDGRVLTANAAKQTGGLYFYSLGINNLAGIEAFTNLTVLICTGNNKIPSLDLSKNTALTQLDVTRSGISNLNVTANTSLTTLNAGNNDLSEIDLRKNTRLKYVDLHFNKLTALDLSKNTDLVKALIYTNEIGSLDLKMNKVLQYLDLTANKLTSLDVSQNTELTSLSCALNAISKLDLSNNTELRQLRCQYNNLSELNLKKLTKLTEVDCRSKTPISVCVDNLSQVSIYWVPDPMITYVVCP